jgi:hypothetical protein
MQKRTEMKTIYVLALAGIVSLLAINGSMAQAGCRPDRRQCRRPGARFHSGRRRRRRGREVIGFQIAKGDAIRNHCM